MSYNKEERAVKMSALFYITEERILWGRYYMNWIFGWMISPSKKSFIFSMLSADSPDRNRQRCISDDCKI